MAGPDFCTAHVRIGRDELVIRDGEFNVVFGPAGLATSRVGNPKQLRIEADSVLRGQGWTRTTRWNSDGRVLSAVVERKG